MGLAVYQEDKRDSNIDMLVEGLPLLHHLLHHFIKTETLG